MAIECIRVDPSWMFIELTDHLRCPADHLEAYLVLLPDTVVERAVESGHLGCPVCGWSTGFQGEVVDFGGGGPGQGSTRLTAEAIIAFLGLSGPGGYVVLAGAATAPAAAVAGELAGIRLVLVNPVAGVTAPAAGKLQAGRIPLKSGSMRGVVLGADLASQEHWVREAARVTLPGLRIVGEGPAPELEGVEVLATGGDTWVARTPMRRA